MTPHILHNKDSCFLLLDLVVSCFCLFCFSSSFSVRGLSKVFDGPTGSIVAVKGADLDLLPGQVFILLGHNGAGKTTTLSSECCYCLYICDDGPDVCFCHVRSVTLFFCFFLRLSLIPSSLVSCYERSR